MGVEKTPMCFDGHLCKMFKSATDKLYGFKTLQNNIAPAAYWRDRSSKDSVEQYKKNSDFLAPLNNEVEHAKSAQYKERFSALNRLYLMCYTLDSVVYPWESQIFGERRVGDNEIEPMQDTDFYKNDLLGLKTLNEAKKVDTYPMAGDHLVMNRV